MPPKPTMKAREPRRIFFMESVGGRCGAPGSSGRGTADRVAPGSRLGRRGWRRAESFDLLLAPLDFRRLFHSFRHRVHLLINPQQVRVVGMFLDQGLIV